MFLLELDHAVVASVWEYDVGGGSIFSDPGAEHSVPDVSLDLSEIQASMQLPQKPASSSNATTECPLYGSSIEAMSKAEGLLAPVPELYGTSSLAVAPLSSPCVPAVAEQPTATAALSGQQLQLVPKAHASCTTTTNKAVGDRPVSELQPAKRAKCVLLTPVASSCSDYEPQTHPQDGGTDAPDIQCGVVPDAFVGGLSANGTCSSCNSDSSTGHAVGSTTEGSGAVPAPGGVPSAPAPASAAGCQLSITPMYMKLQPCSLPSVATKAYGTQPSAAPGRNVSQMISSSKAAVPAVLQPTKFAQQVAVAAAAAGSASTGSEAFVRTRAEALARYREKRARRSHAKKIRYHLRKVNADKRPRIKGRFVKKDELAKYAAETAGGTAAADGSGCWGLQDFDMAAAAADGVGAGSSWQQHHAEYLDSMELPEVPAEVMLQVHPLRKIEETAAGTASTTVPAGSSCAVLDPAAAAAAVEVPALALPVGARAGAVITAGAGTPSDPVELSTLPELFFGNDPAAAAAAADVVAEPQLHDVAAPMPVLGQLPLQFDALGDPHEHLLGDDFFAAGSDASHACRDLHFNWRASQGQ